MMICTLLNELVRVLMTLHGSFCDDAVTRSFIEAGLESGRGVHLEQLSDSHSGIARRRKTKLHLHCLQATLCIEA